MYKTKFTRKLYKEHLIPREKEEHSEKYDCYINTK